jgi:flavodoxin I
MKIVIVYATYSNSTFTAAHILDEELKKLGHTTEVVLARDVQVPQLQAAEVVVIASPSWDYTGTQGMPHEDYDIFKRTIGATTFPDKKFAIMGLGDSTYTYFCGAVTHLEKMVADMQGKLVTESLKLDQFYFAEAENTQKVKQWAATLAQKLS